MQYPALPNHPLTPRRLVAAAAGLLLALGLGALLQGCNRGSEVENELREGKLFYAGGKPAAGAKVRLYAVGHIPTPAGGGDDGLAYSTVTDANGVYQVDSLATGQYNILGEKDGEYSMQDSVFLGRSTGALEPDTLKGPGTVRGVVDMEPNHDTRTVIAQVMGTSSYANVDRQGKFFLGPLAEGKYMLRLATTEAGYTPTFFPFRVQAGQQLDLPDTLRLIFTAIPVVRGLSASFDTANQIVSLSWRSVDYPNFEEYHVFRNDADAIGSNTRAVGKTRDTLRLVARVSNPTRRLKEIRWNVLGQAGMTKARALSGTSVPDTFTVVSAETFNSFLEIQVTDESGTLEKRTFTLQVVGDRPVVSVGPDTLVTAGDTAVVTGRETNEFGSIVKREWDIGATGTWRAVAAGERVRVPGPATSGDSVVCLYRVTDDDGLQDVGQKILRGAKHRIIPLPDGSTGGGAMHPIGSELYTFLLPGPQLHSYHPGTRKWMPRKTHPGLLSGLNRLASAELGGIIYSFENPDTDSTVLMAYDPSRDTWTRKKALEAFANEIWMLPMGGKLYVFEYRHASVKGTRRLWEYDPSTNAWTRKAYPDQGIESASNWTAIDGKIVLKEGVKTWSYDPGSDTWTLLSVLAQGGYAPLPGYFAHFGGGFDLNLVNPLDDSRSYRLTAPVAIPGSFAVLSLNDDRLGIFIDGNWDTRGPILFFGYDFNTRTWSQGRAIQATFRPGPSKVVTATLNDRFFLRDDYTLYEYFEWE